MDYFFKPSVIKSLKKLPRAERKRIMDKINFYFVRGNLFTFAQKIKDESLGSYRFRVGDFRVIFDIERGKAIILLIDNRKDIYR